MSDRIQPPDLQELFATASALPVEQRGAYLSSACGSDPGLREEAESLLSAMDEAGEFLRDPSIDPTDAMTAAIELKEGDVVDDYRLLEKIGEGAHATVFMVEQQEPIRRRAAMKVIKLGMDTREVIARFEMERQALAMMDHPNIAKVFDAGATETGRPFFVMELVKGVPITEYCDLNNLPTGERLQLFISVCQALQHAHLKGVIHRDIKPTNILVTLHDGVPLPKVIDFGIAKATESRLTDRTVFTRFHQFIGTPAYMSPEQAEMSGLDVDTRSDVYSLGVLLYELLTGSTPFDGSELLEAGYQEIQRVIREEEPPKPSTRLSTMASDGLTAVARNRSIRDGELSSSLHGDLDWIVMKALEKDRTRRYETAADLAKDVRRHLSDQPVEASPPGKGYLLRKFVRRHRRAVGATALVALSLLIAILVGGFGLMRAKREAAAAKRQAEKASTITSLLDEMFQSASPDSAKGKDYTVRQLLDEFSMRLNSQLATEPEVEMTLRATIGTAYEGLGDYLQAEPHLQRSFALAQQLYGAQSVEAATASARLGWLTHLLGNSSAAFPQLEGAAKIQAAELGVAHKETLRTQGYLAAVLLNLGQSDRAERVAREVLDSPNADQLPHRPWVAQLLAGIYRTQGRSSEADALTELMVRAAESPQSGEPRTIEALLTAVRDHLADGQDAQAASLIARGLELGRRILGENHRLTLALLAEQAAVTGRTGSLDEAVSRFDEVLMKQRSALGREHPDTIRSLLGLAKLQLARNEEREAQSLAQEAFEVSQQALGDEHEISIASVCELAKVMVRQRRYDNAESLLKEARLAARQKLGETHRRTLDCESLLADLFAKQRDWVNAEYWLTSTAARCRKALGPRHIGTLSTLSQLIEYYLDTGRFGEAGLLGEEMREGSVRGLGEEHDLSIRSLYHLAQVHRKRGNAVVSASSIDEAYRLAVRKWGKGDERTLKVLLERSEVYREGLKVGQADLFLEEGLKQAQEALGAESSWVRRLQGMLSQSQKVKDYNVKVEPTYLRNYHELAVKRGEGHTLTLNARYLWIKHLVKLPEGRSGIEVRKYVKFTRERFGDSHPETIKARSLEAYCEDLTLNYETSNRLYQEVIADRLKETLKLDNGLARPLYFYSYSLHRQGRGNEVDPMLDDWQDRLSETVWPEERRRVLLSRGMTWSFLNYNTDEGSAWKEPGAPPPTKFGRPWRKGRAPFGVRYRGVATTPSHLPTKKPDLTHYFRRNFQVDDPSLFEAVKIRIRREDSAAVYLNGVEVARSNLPDDAHYATPSKGPSYALSVYASYIYEADPTALVPGENTIAVEVHQEKVGSVDMAFDLQLEALLKLQPAP